MDRPGWLDALWQDLRYGLRQLRRSRGFVALAVLTLALGLVAANTIFALVETVVLRPLSYPRSERIFAVYQQLPVLVSGPVPVTLGEFQQWGQSALFERAAAIDATDKVEFVLLGKSRPEMLYGVRATVDFFRVFGVEPLLGRGFVAEDAAPGHENVIVLSCALWKRSFGADPHIVGQPIRVREGRGEGLLTVIGVMPPRFDFPRLADLRSLWASVPEETDFWVPLAITQTLVEQDSFNYGVVGRLKHDVTVRRATEQLRASAVQLFRDKGLRQRSFPAIFAQIMATLSVRVAPLRDAMSQSVRDRLWMLLAAVGLLLAMVLFSLGNLMLTRSASRLQELVVRQALGATPWRIFRESLIEQILVVAPAALISVGVTQWGVSAIRTVAAARVPRLYDLNLDARVMIFLLALCLATALLFSLPLVALRNRGFTAMLHSEGRSVAADRRTNRLKSALVASQIGVSMVLLTGAGLLVRSFTNVRRVEPGFDTHNLVNMRVDLDPRAYPNPAKRLSHIDELLEALRIVPGVGSAAVVNHVPLTGETDIRDVRAVGGPASSTAQAEVAEYRVVDASYFSTMRIPLVEGRGFRQDEPAGFAVVNRKMASRLWPGEDAVGRRFRSGDNPPITVVGVAGDIHDGSLEREPMMQYYVPLAADPWSNEFMIRTRINPSAISPLVQQAAWRLDPEAPVGHPVSMERLLESSRLDRRFETGLVSGLAATALFLATLALFGIASLSATRRVREFGIRLALGARGSDLLRLELRRTLAIAIAGLACGLAASLALARTVARLLYGVTAWNREVYGVAIVVLVVPVFVAAWLPARRAARIDPATTLRYE